MRGRRLNCIKLQLVLILSSRLVLHVQKVFSIPPLPVHQETMYKNFKNSLISDNHSLKPPVTSNHTLFQYVRIFSIYVKIRASSIRSANFKSGLRSDHIFFQLGSDPISKNFEARNFRSESDHPISKICSDALPWFQLCFESFL